ncbi:uncharacterized protein LOC105686728 isoform X1 [Athalia rosae]|uniref:uncharacterized protein LOC105686728 isoform X1 n=2 Tax=Athalia rosae TaxID=37344 RepID=UPI002033F448|nr:uncharacterized protein LOC105686728 isoform X1 [Athalia rosae]
MSDHSDAFDHPKSTLLEDEEMPTFMSVSSKESLPFNDTNVHQLPIHNNSNPLDNNENSNDYQAQSRSPTTEEREDEGNEDNEDNEESSVYVLSSGDEADDRDPSPNSFDEEVDEEEEDEEDDDEEDIDDIDEMDPENEEVDAAEDQLEDFSDEDNERDDVMSDDMALRSDKPKLILQRKRSLSLQDLSDCSAIFPRRKPYVTGGIKYRGVQSKVRRYIQDLKDMGRRSADKRLKSNEEINQNEECQIQVCQDGDETEVSHHPKGRRSIKGYAVQALKDLEIREELIREDSNFISENADHCNMRPNNNVQTKAKTVTVDQPHRYNNLSHEIKLEIEVKKSKKLNLNGELGNDDCSNNLKTPEDLTVNYTMNGDVQGQNILDVRSIGYDEYMRGSSNHNYKYSPEPDKVTGKNDTTIGKNRNSNSTVSGVATMVVTNVDHNEPPNRHPKNLQSEEVIPMEIVEHRDDPKAVAEAATREQIYNETLEEMSLIKAQLNQKTTQCKEIREAYQKTLSENFELKQELEDLKKSLSKMSSKKQSPELVTVAIQTDRILSPAQTTQQIAPADSCVNPKISSSTIASAISYNDQWTESADSLPTSNGSMRPLPNLTPLSVADDSFIGVPSTPLRTPRQPSHAFQTSSKIIKMLSSITQRKSKVDGNIKGQDESTNIFDKVLGSSPAVSSCNSPLNHRISNKRKASDMPENANVLQPPKIPHTTGGFHRPNRRSRSEFAHPGNHVKPNSQSTAQQSSDVNGTQENLEDSQKEEEPREDLDNGVKCFTYREDENSPQTSFLIQAENENKNAERDEDSKRPSSVVVRECGPYLLGNVEVRMTEINGTINIWGKEVNQETIIQDERREETDMDDEANEKDPCECLHKTPNLRIPLCCSTNRKSKIPPLRMDESEFCKNFNSPSTSQPRESPAAADNFRQCQHLGNFMNSVESIRNPKDCESHIHSRSAFKCRRSSNFCEEEFQVEPPRNPNLNKCGCDWEHEGCCSISCGRVSRHCHEDDCALGTTNRRENGTCSRWNTLKSNGHSKTDGNCARNQTLRFPSRCEGKNSTCSHAPRRHSFADDDDDEVFKKPSTSNTRMSGSYCRSRSLSCNDHSDDPLLPHHLHDTSEVLKRRRSSGKRVRGILMDFLRGCGDCRAVNGTPNKVSPGVVPQVRVRPATPPCAAPLNQAQQRTASYGSTNNRCVHTERCATCARRIEMATEIENQLEIFGAEMERLRSRSQAVLGMLNTLHSADTN